MEESFNSREHTKVTRNIKPVNLLASSPTTPLLTSSFLFVTGLSVTVLGSGIVWETLRVHLTRRSIHLDRYVKITTTVG